MPLVTLEHADCDPWVSEHDTDEQADEFAAAWASVGWTRRADGDAPAPAAPVVAPEVPAPAPVDVPAPAGPVNPEGV